MQYNFDDDLEQTLSECLACGGNYEIATEKDDGRYSVRTCRWCFNGAMTKKQSDAWRRFVFKRSSDPKFNIEEILKDLKNKPL